jgi:hypothetical protein
VLMYKLFFFPCTVFSMFHYGMFVHFGSHFTAQAPAFLGRWPFLVSCCPFRVVSIVIVSGCRCIPVVSALVVGSCVD